MTEMKRFIGKVLIFLLIISIVCGGISAFDFFVVGSQYKYSYQAALIDKVNRLESINEPKIILVGHSNLAFGIDSQRLEEAMGMPVVNMGLHGGLGNAFHEETAKFSINKGDIVVVCHSTYSDSDQIDDRALAWITIDNHVKMGSLIRRKDFLPMLAAYPDYVKNALFLKLTHGGNKDTGGCYARSSFNAYGDVVVRPEDVQVDVQKYFSDPANAIHVPKINGTCVNRLNEYNEYITERGASMVVAGFPIAFGEYASFDREDFIAFQEELQKALHCPVISDYTDYFYPYELFYNTTMHLTEEGAEIRTDQLISDLKNWLSQS